MFSWRICHRTHVFVCIVFILTAVFCNFRIFSAFPDWVLPAVHVGVVVRGDVGWCLMSFCLHVQYVNRSAVSVGDNTGRGKHFFFFMAAKDVSNADS